MPISSVFAPNYALESAGASGKPYALAVASGSSGASPPADVDAWPEAVVGSVNLTLDLMRRFQPTLNALKKLIATWLLAMLSSAALAITDADLFTWAAANYAQYFPGIPTAGQYRQYDYRYYPASKNYLAVDTTGAIYVLGPDSGNALVNIGTLATFAPAVTAWEAMQAASPMISLSVDVTAGQKPISDYIYGIHEIGDEKFAKEIGLPARRWGGNNTSRYNWRNYATNDGADWYFENVMYTNTYTKAAETHDQWIAQNERTKTKSMITVPMMGYVAKDGSQSTCSFSTANPSYGTQQDNIEAPWGCGNGLRGGQPLPSGNPLNTSASFAPADATAWVSDLVMKHGAATGTGVKFYSLDNEPDLWHETHRDIHPAAVTYNEIRDLGLVYAKAIKAADSGALVLGPVQSGWMNYFLASHPHPFDQVKWDQAVLDRQSHGMDFIPWYLQQMQAASDSQGVQLLDYLDLHFYPSETGVGFPTKAGNPETQALRLKSTRVLWDPTYVDDSVIGQAGNLISPSQDMGVVRLIPRMKAWVKDYPKIKTAITEYYWGGLEDINGALTQADILGIFGREGLDMAFLFNYPDTGLGIENFETLPGAYAFRMYRNYDGLGGKFGDVSVTAGSADQGQLAIYAAKRSDGATTVMAINKTGNALTGNIAATGITVPAIAQIYRYSATNLTAIVRDADQAVSDTRFGLKFPANSITLLVIK